MRVCMLFQDLNTRVQATEGKALKDAKTLYYDQLNDMLDIILTFTEHGPFARFLHPSHAPSHSYVRASSF